MKRLLLSVCLFLLGCSKFIGMAYIFLSQRQGYEMIWNVKQCVYVSALIVLARKIFVFSKAVHDDFI